MDYAARTYAALLVYPDSCTHDGILPYFHAVANVGIGIDEDASAEFHAPAYVSERPFGISTPSAMKEGFSIPEGRGFELSTMRSKSAIVE